MTLSHKELPDNIAKTLQEVTNNVRIDPLLQSLTGEEQSVGGTVSVDISARGFWCCGQGHFSIKDF